MNTTQDTTSPTTLSVATYHELANAYRKDIVADDTDNKWQDYRGTFLTGARFGVIQEISVQRAKYEVTQSAEAANENRVHNNFKTHFKRSVAQMSNNVITFLMLEGETNNTIPGKHLTRSVDQAKQGSKDGSILENITENYLEACLLEVNQNRSATDMAFNKLAIKPTVCADSLNIMVNAVTRDQTKSITLRS